ncbi:pV [Canine mastadenovirus A]|uniref:PV n=1 Tax=Canine mastadenovirus A TaxID=10537 RepID=A0A6S6MM04_9ADEN|nr:pV [Canine mastadenovirus A]
MAAISRAIKQELLEDLKPEMYLPPKSTRRRAKVKTEEKVDVKTLVKSKSKKRRAAKNELEENVEFVRRFAPRRPYQWRGRQVRALPRPGIPVVFTPGQRSGVASKRSYDEVYADEDVLDQSGNMINEFAYGKRVKMLTHKNPTPSQVPITPQEPIARPGEARLLPTVQVLAPRDSKHETMLPVTKSEGGDVKVENKGFEQITPQLGVQTVDIKVPVKRKSEVEDEILKRAKMEPFETTVKMEYSEQPQVEVFDTGVEPSSFFEVRSQARPIAVARKRRVPTVEVMEVQQSDHTAPTASAAPVGNVIVGPHLSRRPSRWGPANAIYPDYVYHPSISAKKIMGPRPTGRVSRWGPANSIFPEVRLHPSMVSAVTRAAPRKSTKSRRRRRVRTRRAFVLPAGTKTGVMLPQNIRYHPSILFRRA